LAKVSACPRAEEGWGNRRLNTEKETSVAVAGTDVGEASPEAVTPWVGDMRIVRRAQKSAF